MAGNGVRADLMLIFQGGYIELHVDTNPKSNQGVVDYDAGPSEWLITLLLID